MPDGIQQPRRRCLLKLTLGADTRDEMIDELLRIAADLKRGHYTQGHSACGGYSVGWSMFASEDPSITHESYIAALNGAWEGSA